MEGVDLPDLEPRNLNEECVFQILDRYVFPNIRFSSPQRPQQSTPATTPTALMHSRDLVEQIPSNDEGTDEETSPVWLWRQDDGKFASYAPMTSHAIEIAYQQVTHFYFMTHILFDSHPLSQ